MSATRTLMNKKRLMQLLVLAIATTASGLLFADGKEGKALAAADHPKWRSECGSCHALYHPGLLPERSWNRMMADLEHHFGQNAGLDAKTRDEIAKFLAANAADRSNNRRSRKFAQSIGRNEAPLRISETAYFVRKHDEVRAEVWKRPGIGSPANCLACHPGTEQGNFAERDIRIPH